MTHFLIGLLLLSFQPEVAAQVGPDSWYGGQVRPREVSDKPLVFDKTFSIAIPSNWQIASGRAHTIFNVVEKTKSAATIMLEQERLNALVPPDDPETLSYFTADKLEEVQKFEPRGEAFTADVLKGRPGNVVILIQYRRRGVFGDQNHIVQYLIPVGRTLYRLTCIAPASEVEKKYKKIFAWVAASFTPIPPTAEK
jgi:hypothetical protein